MPECRGAGRLPSGTEGWCAGSLSYQEEACAECNEKAQAPLVSVGSHQQHHPKLLPKMGLFGSSGLANNFCVDELVGSEASIKLEAFA